ncbi:MAG: class I poly(R)-hydroxyalkanoic acid synthase [Hyphomonadaceae bacterium]|nr:class I poly(R)-hydroxyalkanoic acid synthase [Hyphomonadaceae bacterium]
MTRANQVFSTAFLDQAKDSASWQPDPLGVQPALNEVWQTLAQQPETLREAHAQLWQRYADIWQRHAAYMLTGKQPDEGPVRDKRFRDPEWRSNPAFSMLRESYLATSEFITSLVEKAEGIDEATKRKAAFFIKQAVDAASPSNFLMTNPAALRALLSSHGESLLKGVENLAGDLKRGQGALAISQTDLDAFKVGENVANSPGKVIFRNRVFELIQYSPTTELVHDVPLLIFPPWINKFYILDLQPKNSMIRWLTDQGHTVFLVSWVNPDEDMAEVGFEHYMREGVYAAVDAVQQAIGADHINTVGYCVGGTLLAATLAHMAKVGDTRIQSATFFASQADFKCAGDLLVFADNAGINFLEAKMEQAGGVLEAQTMADTFNALRSNDLIWNYVVDNYYIGKQPPPFDLLYWNADQTRMPKALHLFYLRNFYRDNALSEGQLTLLGQKLSLQDVKIPIFMQSSKEDHIAPAQSVFRSALQFGGPVEFIVAGSGHIAGVINHPAANKYQYWTNKTLVGAVEDWFAFAHEHPGSWWPHWDRWLRERSGPDVPARTPGDGGLKPLCDAPGEYVRVKSSAA